MWKKSFWQSQRLLLRFEIEASDDGFSNGCGFGVVGFEDGENGADIGFFVLQPHQWRHIAIGKHVFLVEHAHHLSVVAFFEIEVKFAAERVVDVSRIDFVQQIHHVIFQRTDIGETLIDAQFHLVLHAMAHMLHGLLLELVFKHAHHGTLHLHKHLVGVFFSIPCHRFHHLLYEQDVFHFRHIRHQYFFGTQICHLLFAASVTVDDAPTIQVVERLQIIERAHAFYHLIATAERLHRIVAENERIEFAINAVRVVALNKENRLAAAQNVEVNALAQVVARHFSPTRSGCRCARKRIQ